MKFAIAVHGGAGTSPDRFSSEANRQRRESIESALATGIKILRGDGPALDAVCEVVRFLEDDPQFNAGVGAVFNANGSHELDASVMCGATLAAGAVAGVSRVKNPVLLAREVLKNSPHILLSGNGAEEFARQLGMELVSPEYFDTPGQFAAWKRTAQHHARWKPGDPVIPSIEEIGTDSIGTVGCVALDSAGNVAAATSSGGMSNKRFGRIGDSPIIGAGTYANNASVAVSCTGVGEIFIRHSIAFNLAQRLTLTNQSLDSCVRTIFEEVLPGDSGGLISIDFRGNINMTFNTGGMARGAADSSGRFDVMWD